MSEPGESIMSPRGWPPATSANERAPRGGHVTSLTAPLQRALRGCSPMEIFHNLMWREKRIKGLLQCDARVFIVLIMYGR